MKCQLTTRTLDALAAIYKSFYWDIISFAGSPETSVSCYYRVWEREDFLRADPRLVVCPVHQLLFYLQVDDV